MKPPKSLRERKQWLNWKNVNGNKIPMAKDGSPGKSNDPSTWSTYQSAVRVANKFDGIAFVFSEDDPFCGIDLDNCLGEDGNLLEWAIPFVTKFSEVAYGEISPSGKGIKFITRGTKPKGSRCVHVVNAELKQQVEVYDNKRFWTITGDLYSALTQEVGEGQAAVDWVCSEFLLSSGNKPVAQTTQPVLTPISSDDLNLEKRLEAYLAGIPREAEGGRNNTLFKLAGNITAFREGGLPEDVVMGWCRQWNESLPEPLEEEEFVKTVRSGMRNGTPREFKEERSLPELPPDVDFSNLRFGVQTPKQQQSPDKHEIPPELIYDAPGMIGAIVRWMDATCLYSLPEVFFASALGIMSLLTGRKICDPLNGRTNLYLLALSPTGAGKEHPRKCTKILLEKAGDESLLAPEDFGSSAGLYARLDEHPATLFQVDEFGKFLAGIMSDKAQPYLKALEADLLKVYTSANSSVEGRAYVDTSRTVKLNQPHCVIVGSSTPSTLWDALSSDSVHTGLLGRLHVLEEPKYVPLADSIPESVGELQPPAELVEHARFWLNYQPEGAGNLESTNPMPTEILWSPEARERLVGHMREIALKRIDEDPLMAAIWSRSSEKANKLAMLSAVSQGRFTINLEDADWAIKLQNILTRKLAAKCEGNLADSPYERLKQKVLSKISGRMSWTEFGRRTQFLTKKQRDDIVAELQEAGRVQMFEAEKQPGKTRSPRYIERLDD